MNGEAASRIDVIFFRHSSSLSLRRDRIGCHAAYGDGSQRCDQQRLAGPLDRSVDNRQGHMPGNNRPHQDREQDRQSIGTAGLIGERKIADHIEQDVHAGLDFVGGRILRDRRQRIGPVSGQ